jgi:hypothetical protein
MDEKPITLREVLLPLMAVGIAFGAWSGWLSDGVAMTFILAGTTGAACGSPMFVRAINSDF